MIDRFRRHKRIFITLILVLMLCGGWVGIYAYTSGFTAKWKRSLEEEFAQRGISADIGRITLDPARGLVARDVRFYYDKEKKVSLAAVNRISLDVDYTKLLRSEMFLRKIEFRDARVWLRADPDRRDQGRVNISGISASIRLPEDRIEIDKAEGTLHGFRIGLRGTLFKPLEKPGSKKKPGSPTARKPILTGHKFLYDIAMLLEPFDYKGGGQPHIDFEISGDLGEPEMIEARCVIATGQLGYGEYELDQFAATGDYKLGTFTFGDISLRDQSGSLSGECAIDVDSGAVKFSIDSTADAIGIVREAIDRPPLGNTQLYSSPHLTLRGSIDRIPDSWSQIEVFPGKIVGHCELENFGDERILFERFAADFSIDHEKIYMRNAELEHHTGPASCSFLYDPKDGLQFDATLKMDPTSLAPFLPEGPDRAFLEDWEFERVASVHIEIRGSGPGFRTRNWTANGTANIIGSHRFRQFPMRSIQADFARTPGRLEVTSCEIETATGKLDARQILHDDDSGTTTFGDVRGPMDLTAAASVIAPPLLPHLKPFQFAEPPNITLNGTVNTATGEADVLSIRLRSESSMDLTTGSQNLTLEDVDAAMILRGDTLIVERARASLGGGQINVSGTLDKVFSRADTTNTTVVLEKVDIKELPEFASIVDLAQGTASGALTLQGTMIGANALQGTLRLQLFDTNLFQLPVISPLSVLVDEIYPEQEAAYGLVPLAKLELSFDEDRIQLKRLEAANKLFTFSMLGTAKRSGEDLSASARIQPSASKGQLLGLIGSFLRYECDGSIAQPRWRAHHLIPLKLKSLPAAKEGAPTPAQGNNE